MSRILTGIQSTGTPHLGNLLGAIIPAIKMANSSENESYLFIADMHSVTQIKDPKQLKYNTYSTAACWLAFGLNYNKTVFYRQSDVPQVTELAWYLNCYFPYQRLTLAHSFKDKSNSLEDINAGLFTYPMLMAADILLYDANIVPVGKDQLQHLEITRSVANKFNHQNGDTFIVPESRVDKNTMLIAGTDGNKMSKSKKNIIDIFLEEKLLKKQISNIKTDSLPLEASKDWKNCNLFKMYKLLADEEETEMMKKNYTKGGYGYGHAKTDLLNLILTKYSSEREKYTFYMSNLDKIDSILNAGALQASKTADEVLNRVRIKVGFN
ncbi:tryptophan--tRNA ligase [Flavobacteriaceae bacterium]|nr:tryptophan--tRNA ligase [Flavobacteriaceae bacterium]MDA9631745.1 tryptophan--tRNA ligase [Bacteroidota bacterium]MDB4212640.1 tryptophan--tRNA ligase [Flavobacteriaceae bacterium]MDC1310304.1 tryptophan--tRNA ligase [Flavobacteriaceae bacterium]MDC1321588.1 tryptophan--tRNA ligase [Flavobacteriaceae bacterium]